MRGYWGLVPITILMGAAVGAGGFGPLSIPPKWSQSPGHCCFTASRLTEMKAATSASQAAPICPSVPSLNKTTIPVAAPTPDQFQDSASHFAFLRRSAMTPEIALGSGPSPKMYMAAFVPANPDSNLINLGISLDGIDLGAFSFSRANRASRARAFASAISLPVSSLYLSNSIFDSAISILCSLTTAQVAAPAISAKNPAMISDTTMAFSQPWSESPSIRLTSFEIAAISAIALVSIGFIVLILSVVWDLILRQPKR